MVSPVIRGLKLCLCLSLDDNKAVMITLPTLTAPEDAPWDLAAVGEIGSHALETAITLLGTGYQDAFYAALGRGAVQRRFDLPEPE